MQVKQYQNIGFSLEDIRVLFSRGDLTQFIKHLGDKIEANQEAIKMLQIYLDSSFELKQRLTNFDIFFNRCFFKVKEAHYRHEHLRYGKIIQNEEAMQARDIAMKILPSCDYSLIILKDDVERLGEQAISIGCDICINDNRFDLMGFDQLKQTSYSQQQECIFTVCKVEAFEEISWRHLRYVQDFMTFNRLKLAGDIQATIMINALDEEADETSRKRFFEVWIPIQGL